MAPGVQHFLRDRLLELRGRFLGKVIGDVSLETRRAVLYLIQAIEEGHLTYEDPRQQQDELRGFWGQVAYLNGQLELPSTQTAQRRATPASTVRGFASVS